MGFLFFFFFSPCMTAMRFCTDVAAIHALNIWHLWEIEQAPTLKISFRTDPCCQNVMWDLHLFGIFFFFKYRQSFMIFNELLTSFFLAVFQSPPSDCGQILSITHVALQLHYQRMEVVISISTSRWRHCHKIILLAQTNWDIQWFQKNYLCTE